MNDGILYNEVAERLGVSKKLIRFLIIVGYLPVMRFHIGGENDDITFLRISPEVIDIINPDNFPDLKQIYPLTMTILVSEYSAVIQPVAVKERRYSAYIKLENLDEDGYIDVKSPLHTAFVFNEKHASLLITGNKVVIGVRFAEDGDRFPFRIIPYLPQVK